MMIRFLFCHFLTAGISLGVQVHKFPSAVIRKAGDNAQLVCTHGQTDYTVMVWYQYLPGEKALKLIGYVDHSKINYEELYKDHFNITGDLSGNTAKNGSLFIVDLKEPEHSAVYYCAARYGAYSEAYFGAGTKLTVLESGLEVTKPTVKVLKPSKKECRNSKDERKKKTLVCVASRFYPDHVSVNWEINGANVEDGVATDNAALRNGSYYKITSRLRVFVQDWNKKGKNFTCIVSFFNGKETITVADTILGVKGKNVTRDKYMRITHTAKFSYSVFIAKSSIYGAFVAFLVWKLQGSGGKWNN